MNDEEKEVIRQKLVAAKAEQRVLKADMGRTTQGLYSNPQQAYLAMVKHYRSKGETDLMEKLKSDPSKFGALNGSFMSTNWKPLSPGHKKLIADYSRDLPPKVKALIDADNKVAQLEDVMFGKDPFPGPNRGRDRDGPDR